MRKRFHLRDSDFSLGIAILLSDTVRLVLSSFSDGFPFHVTFRLGERNCEEQKFSTRFFGFFRIQLLVHVALRLKAEPMRLRSTQFAVHF